MIKERMSDNLPSPYLDAIQKKLTELGKVWLSLKAQPEGTDLSHFRALLKRLITLSDAMQLTEVTEAAHIIRQYIATDLKPEHIDPISQLIKKIAQMTQSARSQHLGFQHPADQITSPHRILFGIPDLKRFETIAKHFQYFGYICDICSDITELEQQLTESDLSYSAIILEADFAPNGDPQRFLNLPPIPLIFLSQENSFELRLFCVQAKGQAFFTDPIEYSTLIEKVDSLISPVNEDSPFRILIIEDSKTQASFVQQTLVNAGMITEVLYDPIQINDTLTEFRPELILMDLYMPKCTGVDLAKVIRQQESYVSIPIVFLSSEDDIKTQMDAMALGAEDFLTKPVQTDHLISSIKSRVIRSRTLRAEMIQDSLTGLLNHTCILEQLQLEIERAKREQTPLAFAMIDIDHFKNVNDNHGHPVGDRVIKSLSRLLKQYLRKSDSIGRYGGEEFAVILPHADSHIVLNHLNHIREGFQQIAHQGNKTFHCSFSAGVSELSPTCDTVDSVCEAADKALYLAKHQGRNRIVCHQPLDESEDS